MQVSRSQQQQKDGDTCGVSNSKFGLGEDEFVSQFSTTHELVLAQSIISTKSGCCMHRTQWVGRTLANTAKPSSDNATMRKVPTQATAESHAPESVHWRL